MVRTLPISHGYTVLVDDEDYAWLSQWQWTASQSRDRVYASRQQRSGREQHHIYMHREILGITDAGFHVLGDHINHDTLDNRRENLRVVNRTQNTQNRSGATKASGTGIRNVGYDKRRGTYCVSLKCAGRKVWLGSTKNIDAAARMAEEGRRKYLSHSTH